MGLLRLRQVLRLFVFDNETHKLMELPGIGNGVGCGG